MRAGLRRPVRIGLSLLIGIAIAFSLAYSVWGIVALTVLMAAYFVLVRRA
jgi:uncharacterized membrane protein